MTLGLLVLIGLPTAPMLPLPDDRVTELLVSVPVPEIVPAPVVESVTPVVPVMLKAPNATLPPAS